MFIERSRINQLNKNIFGHGILETKKLIPDSGRIVMPDPSLPKIKRYNIKSNNPLNYLLMTNGQTQNQAPIYNSQPQNMQMEPEPQENINDNDNDNLKFKSTNEELYSHKSPKEEVKEIQEEPPAEPEVPVQKKFTITDLGENNILLPPNYSTDDELEYKFINLINESKDNYKFACKNDYCQVYKRRVS